MQKRNEQAPVGLAILAVALLPFGLGYFLSYLYRAANAVVAADLVRDVGLSAGQLGLLTATYLLAFALFQLPLGVLLDRYGPRRVQAALVAVGGIGALLFALGQSATALMAARALIGVGFAGGLMSAFKAVVIWVPEPRRALANSCVMSIGALGLLVATAPLERAVQAFGWRTSFLAMAAFTALIAGVILLVVPERATAPAAAVPLRQQVAELGQIFRNRVFRALVPVLALTAGAQIALQTLWIGPWYRDIAGLDRGTVADRLFVMALAFFAGILVIGAVADWLSRRGVSLLSIMLGFLVLFLAAQACLVLGVRGYDTLIWVVFNMTGQVSVLAFPWLSSYFGARLSGRANTAANLPMFLAAFGFQYLVGAIIDLYPPTPTGGYAPDAYATAFACLLFAELAALVWYLANAPHIAAAEQVVAAATRPRTAKAAR